MTTVLYLAQVSPRFVNEPRYFPLPFLPQRKGKSSCSNTLPSNYREAMMMPHRQQYIYEHLLLLLCSRFPELYRHRVSPDCYRLPRQAKKALPEPLDQSFGQLLAPHRSCSQVPERRRPCNPQSPPSLVRSPACAYNNWLCRRCHSHNPAPTHPSEAIGNNLVSYVIYNRIETTCVLLSACYISVAEAGPRFRVS